MTTKLHSGGYQGEVYIFNLKGTETKDPSEIYIKHGTDAASIIKTAIEKAEIVDIQTESENLPELVKCL